MPSHNSRGAQHLSSRKKNSSQDIDLTGKADCKLPEHACLLPFGHFSSIPVYEKI